MTPGAISASLVGVTAKVPSGQIFQHTGMGLEILREIDSEIGERQAGEGEGGGRQSRSHTRIGIST